MELIYHWHSEQETVGLLDSRAVKHYIIVILTIQSVVHGYSSHSQ